MAKLRASGLTVQVGLAFAAVYLIWGSTYLAILFAIETLPPLLMAAGRFLSAGALLYGVMRWQGVAAPTRQEWLGGVMVGGLLLLGGNGMVVLAEQWVPTGIAALLVATVPLWMVVLEWLRPGGSRPTSGTLLGVALGLVGMGLLVGPTLAAGSSAINPFGVLLVLLAALSWAFGSLYSRQAALPSSPLMATAVEMVAGGALLLLAGTLTGEWSHFDPGAVSLRSLLAFGYLAVFGSLIAFTAYVWLLRVVNPALVATYAYINPVVAVFLGWAFVGETITARTMVATAVIVGAVALITMQKARATDAAKVAPSGAKPKAKAALSES
jgi:drug/metabolite transporter (DMT)-like permease